MICRSVSLKNFRNIQSADVSFCEGINLVLGNNAQGKTNLLESIALMAIGKSFRGAKEGELIRFGAPSASVTLRYVDDVREQEIALSLDQTKRRVWTQNQNKVAKVADMVGRFRVVIFMPEHLSIIKSGPEMRRSFLDIALCQMRPRYLYLLQRYQGILKERNKLLKQAKDGGLTLSEIGAMLDVWTEQLAEHAEMISRYRADFVKKMNAAAITVFEEMTGGREVPAFVYKGTLGYDEGAVPEGAKGLIFDKLRASYTAELAVGSTLHGCHRDDIEILLNGKSARSFASQGQQRSLSLAMKLAEGEISRQEHGDYPVFLFDDVLSELDRSRREYLISKIRGRQVILTGCESVDAFRQLSGQDSCEHVVIAVEGGKFYSEV